MRLHALQPHLITNACERWQIHTYYNAGAVPGDTTVLKLLLPAVPTNIRHVSEYEVCVCSNYAILVAL
jgi:hypothetical protein